MEVPRAASSLPQLLLALRDALRSPVVMEGRATLCAYSHPLVLYDPGPPPSRAPLHVDVELRMWNRTGKRVTLLDVAAATLGGVALTPGGHFDFKEVTLEPGGPSLETMFTLTASDTDELAAHEGEHVKIRFRSSRGSSRLGAPHVTLRVRLPGADL